MKKLFLTVLVAIGIVSIAIALYVATALDEIQPTTISQEKVGFYSGTGTSTIVDQRGDARPIQQYETTIVPSVMGYHDILWASVQKIDNAFILTIGLDGNPNLNEKYETVYMWHIMTSTGQVYTILFPNFAPDSDFAAEGWYFAVYNNTVERYMVPMMPIDDMPEDRIEFPLDASIIGNPQSFHYWVSVHVRVDSENLDKPPDYLMDYAP